MKRYLVESVHEAKDCDHILELFMFHGHILNFDWGCELGVHSGWAQVDAENESEALLSVPPHLRSKSRAVRLNKFTPEMIQSLHK